MFSIQKLTEIPRKELISISLVYFLFFSCSPPTFSNHCDPTSKNYLVTKLLKSAFGDNSEICSYSPHSGFATPVTISGIITGLVSSGLVLQNNNTDGLTIANGGRTFTFPIKTNLYNVTVKTTPFFTNCTVTNGSGISASDITNIIVNCNLNTLNISGIVTTIAGNGLGSSDGIGTAATFNTPQGTVSDGSNLYIADNNNYTIRKLFLSSGQVTTIAGSAGLSGSTDGIGTSARFNQPQALFLDGSNLYIADVTNRTIRKMAIETGQVSTIAGTVGVAGNLDGTGTAATFNNPVGISGDGKNLYVANFGSHTIRKIVISNNEVTTIAGSAGVSGSLDATGLTATFFDPYSTVYDGINLYIADFGNHTIRKLVLSSVNVSTIAGLAATNTPTGQDGTGTAARFNNAQDMLIDGTYMYITDRANHSIRKMVLATGAVTTIAGLSGTSGNADGTGTIARFNNPEGICTDGVSLYITDSLNHLVRKIQ